MKKVMTLYLLWVLHKVDFTHCRPEKLAVHHGTTLLEQELKGDYERSLQTTR